MPPSIPLEEQHLGMYFAAATAAAVAAADLQSLLFCYYMHSYHLSGGS